jgi:phenolic acid decarboxylase
MSELSVEFIPNNVDQEAYASACTELFTNIRTRLAWHKAYPTARGFNLTEDPQVWIESLPKILDAISHNKKLMSTASLQSERNKNIYEEVLENLVKAYREHNEQYPTKLIDANAKESFLHDYESAASGADVQIYYNLLSAKLDDIHDEHVNQVKVSVTYKCKMIDTLIVEYFKSKREKIEQAYQSFVALFLECENKFNLLTTDVEQKYIICGWQETITTLFLEKKLDNQNMCTYGNHHCDRPASHQESMEISPEYNIDERYDIVFLWACEHGHFEKVQFLVRNHKKYLHAKKDLACDLADRNGHSYIKNWVNTEFQVPFKINSQVYDQLHKSKYIKTINYLANYHNINYTF